MRRIILVLTILAVLPLQVFSQGSKEKTELTVFAAASLAETLTEIKGMYEAENPGVSIICNFDSSGTLKTQIQMGADCDLFISASTKQMTALTESGLIDVSTCIELLENRTALAVPAGNPKGITDFDQMAKSLKDGNLFMAIGNSDVPVGQYTQKIFNYYQIDETSVQTHLSYGSNAKEVTTQVKEGSVDCGIVYSTDAFTAGLEVVDVATQEMTGGRVIYPAAVLSDSKASTDAKAFLEYLQTSKALEVFRSVGFYTDL